MLTITEINLLKARVDARNIFWLDQDAIPHRVASINLEWMPDPAEPKCKEPAFLLASGRVVALSLVRNIGRFFTIAPINLSDPIVPTGVPAASAAPAAQPASPTSDVTAALEDAAQLAINTSTLQQVRAQPVPDWVEKIELRTSLAEMKPAMALSEIHAVLTDAIAAGRGSDSLAIGLAYQDGLLCGTPSVQVSGFKILQPHNGIWGFPYLLLETDRSVMLMHRSTFENAMKVDALENPQDSDEDDIHHLSADDQLRIAHELFTQDALAALVPAARFASQLRGMGIRIVGERQAFQALKAMRNEDNQNQIDLVLANLVQKGHATHDEASNG